MIDYAVVEESDQNKARWLTHPQYFRLELGVEKIVHVHFYGASLWLCRGRGGRRGRRYFLLPEISFFFIVPPLSALILLSAL